LPGELRQKAGISLLSADIREFSEKSGSFLPAGALKPAQGQRLAGQFPDILEQGIFVPVSGNVMCVEIHISTIAWMRILRTANFNSAKNSHF